MSYSYCCTGAVKVVRYMFFSKWQKSMMYVKKVKGNQMKFRKAVSMFPFSIVPFQTHLYQLKISMDLYSAMAYNRIRQSRNSVYGAQTFVSELIGIFLRSPYTKSICRRIAPYTIHVSRARIRTSYSFVFLRQQSCMRVYVRFGFVCIV